MRRLSPILFLAIYIATMDGCAQVPPHATPAPQSLTPFPNNPDIDSTAQELLSALKAGDATAATAHFDSTMKAALPVDRLDRLMKDITGQQGHLLSWSLLNEVSKDAKVVRTYDLAFEKGRLRGLIAIDPKTHDIAGLHFLPAAAPIPIPGPRGYHPSPHDEEIRLGSTTDWVPGTLTPAVQRTSRSAAAVLIAGSGPRDRDETVGTRKPFRDLASALSARGITVLRFDKRTYFRPEEFELASVSVEQEIVNDAVAAVQFLKQRSGVDPNRVFLVGHSLGGFVAPEIAERARPVAGLALLAPPGRPLWQVALEQLRARGVPVRDLASLESQAKLIEEGRAAPGTMFLGAPASYWLDLSQRDEFGIARRLRIPLLILRGDRDSQVSEEDINIWKRELAGVPGTTIVTVPGMDHMLGHCSADSKILCEGIDPALVDQLITFMSS